MEQIDPTNPNLDADFVQLHFINQKRKESAASTIPETEPQVAIEKASLQTDECDADVISDLRKKLFQAARSNNMDDLTKVCAELHLMKIDHTDEQMKDPDDCTTALHIATESKSRQAAFHLIRTCKTPKYLMAECDVSVGGIPSTKTCLHALAESGDTLVVEELLVKIGNAMKVRDMFWKETFINIDVMGVRPMAPIHIAAFKGHTKLLELLLRNGDIVGHVNNKRDTPLMYAASANQLDMVRRLIQLRADINSANDKGSTALYFAVRYGFTDMVKLLTEEGGANVNLRRKVGLGYPVVLATALGYIDILTLLLKSGADVDTQITNDRTALHLAAAAGLDEAVKLLLEYQADVDSEDDSGMTPLHYATKHGHISTMLLLCANSAYQDARTKSGKTIWNFALEVENLDVLREVVGLFRKSRRLKGRKLIFPKGRTPLHEAALVGDLMKIKYLIEVGADPQAEDQAMNTFLHVAARENKVDILNAFISDNGINTCNKHGEIPIHLAIERGHVEAVNVLVKKSQLDLTKHGNYTALHIACWTEMSSPAIVGILIENIIKNSNWSLLDHKDMFGNTPLHVAALMNRPLVLPELDQLNPCVLNISGDNPLHAAARKGHTNCLEIMYEVFNKPGTGLDINQENEDGETLLHISAKCGNQHLVGDLILAGANLQKKNYQGNTVLHEIVEEMANDPSCTQKILAVYRKIVKTVPAWWCIKKGLQLHDEGSELFHAQQRTSLLYLICDVYNLEGLNVLGYSASLGALPLFKEMLNTDYVFRMPGRRQITFDVTNFTPDTIVKEKNRSSSLTGSYMRNSSFSYTYEDDFDFIDGIPSNNPYLNILVNMKDNILATQFLDVTPVRQMSENLFNAYQWTYMILLVVQIVYMTCLSLLAMDIDNVTSVCPANASVVTDTSSGVGNETLAAVHHHGGHFKMAIFLVWPFLLITFECFYIISWLRSFLRRWKTLQITYAETMKAFTKVRIFRLGNTALEWVFDHLAGWTAFLFSSFVTIWFGFYITGKCIQFHFLSFTMILGWMFSITFTKGFKNVHAFSTMLSYIIIRDVTRFFIIYIFVLLGFSFALHSLLQLSIYASTKYNSPFDTIFLTFNLMTGMVTIFEDNFHEQFPDNNRTYHYIKIVYLLYIILATIILINLLIAMLSDTYNDIKSKEGTTWRVNSLRMALNIEKLVPWVKQIVKLTGQLVLQPELDPNTQRYMLTLPIEDAFDTDENNVNEITRNLQTIEDKLELMEITCNDMNEKIDEMGRKVENFANHEPSSRKQSKHKMSQLVTKFTPPTSTPMRHLSGRKRMSHNKTTYF